MGKERRRQKAKELDEVSRISGFCLGKCWDFWVLLSLTRFLSLSRTRITHSILCLFWFWFGFGLSPSLFLSFSHSLSVFKAFCFFRSFFLCHTLREREREDLFPVGRWFINAPNIEKFTLNN